MNGIKAALKDDPTNPHKNFEVDNLIKDSGNKVIQNKKITNPQKKKNIKRPIKKPVRKQSPQIKVHYISELKDKHKGDDIYVICSGKSCDYINPNFFNGKITIGVNQAYKKFKTTYLVRKELRYLEKVIEDASETIHCITVGDCGGDNKKNLMHYLENKELHQKEIYFMKHAKNIHTLVCGTGDNMTVSFSTTTTALHLAAYMGAINILLVGNDGGILNGQTNFEGYYDGIKPIPKDYGAWVKSVSNDTGKLKSILEKRYNCNIYSINPFTNLRLDGNNFQ